MWPTLWKGEKLYKDLVYFDGRGAYKITGAILKACVWLLILLPIGLILSGVGVIFCCTIILIPVGIGIIKAGIRMILPG